VTAPGPPRESLELDETAAAVGSTATEIPRERVPDAPAGQLAPGRLLAHYRIDRLLGQGGMGQVYLATDLALDRQVALKVLPPAVAQDPGKRQRLIREARAQARINHPNVCHIYFIGEEDGHLFFAMEYVDGESVAELVGRGPLPVDRALAIVRMAADGLREADRSGFTHRDVKPSNLMIDRAGRVKVVDFGLVTAAPELGPEPGDVAATGIAGTPLYMAPEQARGEAVDRRADVYALGATLYHLVAGAPPFQAESAAELLAMHSTAIRPDLPRKGRGGERRRLPALDELCQRMMAPAVDDRYASYDALIADLDRATPAVTRPAGIVARGAAVLIDLLVVVPFALVGEQVPYYLVIDANILVIAGLWLYGTLATWRFGRTIGKTLLDLEVAPIAIDRRRVSLLTAAARTGIFAGPLLAAMVMAQYARTFDNRGLAIAANALVALAVLSALGSLAWASWRRPDKRTHWDRLTGTMVRYHRPA
jgi:hypothetical protein